METEWKQILRDSGITEDLQLGRENVSGLKGKWSKIYIYRFTTTSRIFVFYYHLYYSFLTICFLCSADYYQYYQNVTNDEIIKLYEKFKPDFLSFDYTLDGFLNKA